jgi:hypothetical protein
MQLSGHRAMELVGECPVVFLHARPTIHSPIIGAAGEELFSHYEVIRQGSNADIILLDHATTAIMRAWITDEGNTAFSF